MLHPYIAQASIKSLDRNYLPFDEVLACSIAIALIASKELRLALPSIALTARS